MCDGSQALDASEYVVLMGAAIDQVNVVVGDVAAASRFLSGLGVALPPSPSGWESHHRSIPSATSVHGGHDSQTPMFGIDLDSGPFGQQWGGLAPSFSGVVMNVRVDDRTEVDRLHEQSLVLGGRSLKEPYDAFWGLATRSLRGQARWWSAS